MLTLKKNHKKDFSALKKYFGGLMREKCSCITDNIKEYLIQEEDGVADEAQLWSMWGWQTVTLSL